MPGGRPGAARMTSIDAKHSRRSVAQNHSRRSVADRRASAGRKACLAVNPKAGHRVVLPGETAPRSASQAHGGTDRADMELGQAAWVEIARLPGMGAAAG